MVQGSTRGALLIDGSLAAHCCPPGLPEWIAAVNREYLTAYAQGRGDYTTSTFTDVTSHPGRSFADFAKDHAAHLRS
ncbi:hypothetical protein [Nonomuraea sp. B1E8]|uniref:hypothetical protein n=1 Tax=unclassified Nonomuraea TaxID=2593643 RepID=UPI00325DD07A